MEKPIRVRMDSAVRIAFLKLLELIEYEKLRRLEVQLPYHWSYKSPIKSRQMKTEELFQIEGE